MTSPADIDAFIAAAHAFILSGGAARRAGGINKSLLHLPDPTGPERPIIEHQLQRLRPLFGSRITVITDRATEFTPFDLATLPDFDSALPEERFPLRGFARALAAASAPPSGFAFLLAADMPWPDADLIRAQARRLLRDAMGEQASSPGPSGLVLLHAGRVQPFHAFYHASLAASARVALSREDRSLRAWIASEPSILTIPAEELAASAASLELAFRGFNTPPDAGISGETSH